MAKWAGKWVWVIFVALVVGILSAADAPEVHAQPQTIVIYGFAGNWDLWFQNWGNEFAKETGIRIQYLSGPATQMRQRIIMEKASKSDVFISTPGDAFSLAAAGMLTEMPWSQMSSASSMDAKFKYKYVGIYGYDIFLIAYNKKKVTGTVLPTKWTDLASPQWRGRLSLPDPSQDTVTRLYMVLADRYGQQRVWGLMQAIYRNARVTWSTPGDSERNIAMGTADVAPLAMGSVMVATKQAGGDVGAIVPQDGGFLMLNSISIMRNAPNRAGAIAFANWFLSRWAQNDIMNNLGISIATNRTVPLTNQDIAKIGLGGANLQDVLRAAYVPDWNYWVAPLGGGKTRYGELQQEITARLRAIH